MGIGSARGDNRAVERPSGHLPAHCSSRAWTARAAYCCSIAGGSDLGLFEINRRCPTGHDAAHSDANIIFGAVIDDALGDEVRVTVIAAGFDGGAPAYRPAEAQRRSQSPTSATRRS